MLKFLVTAAILTVSTVSAKANDGNELFSECTSSKYVDKGFCVGFVDGVVSATSDICVPKGVKLGQLVSIVGKFLQENPSIRHYRKTDIVTASVRAVFPCFKKVGS